MADQTVVADVVVELKLDAVNETFSAGFAETNGRMVGLVQSCADGYSIAFGGGWWNRVEEKSETGRAIRAGKKDLYARLKARECTNPSVYWARILVAAGKPETAKTDPTPRALDPRIIEEVTKLHKAVANHDTPSVNALMAAKHLDAILKIYNVTVDTE